MAVVIGDGITSIGGGVFRSHTALESAVIGNGVTSIGGDAFAYGTSLTSIIIPDSVTSIGDAAFGNSHLTSIEIPNSVTSIGNFAFSHSTLTSVIIGDKVTSIGNEAFRYCSRLTSIYSHSTTPPTTGAFNFTNINALCCLYVPAESVSAYTLATGWSNISCIQAFYTVTFNSQGGTNVNSQTVGHNKNVTEPPPPTLTNYTFSGWYKEV